MKRMGLLFAGIFILSMLNAQTKVVKGQLTMFNQYPVANLQVSAKKAKSIAPTDAQGKFELPCKEKDFIIIKDPVFQTISRRVGQNDGVFAINLIYKDSPKNRELATSMGYISQKDLEYAIKNLQHENNDYCLYPDVYAILRSKYPELSYVQSDYGHMYIFMNRGVRSITGRNHAICTIDGIRTDDISTVNPCEIVKIFIVRSGTAAKYGTGAANGVVVIETRKARN